MLQQTRIEAVIPYYHRFLEKIPSVEKLAEISEDELLKLWEGLGYYSRARNLKKAAEKIMKDFGGEMPRDPKTLESRLLPGLFFAGEVLDVDGPCGGYNISWALASGFTAGGMTEKYS